MNETSANRLYNSLGETDKILENEFKTTMLWKVLLSVDQNQWCKLVSFRGPHWISWLGPRDAKYEDAQLYKDSKVKSKKRSSYSFPIVNF